MRKNTLVCVPVCVFQKRCTFSDEQGATQETLIQSRRSTLISVGCGALEWHCA